MLVELPFALGELAVTCSPALPEGAAQHSRTCPKPCAISWEVLGGWLLLFWCLSAPTWPRQGTVETAAMGRHVAGARVEERRGKHLKIRAISMLGDV